ncbi:MAG: Transcription factor spt8 [Phylliscum demangeonii]|nr:MAG: Transcription factor spt8 [Phylliscum demangeonii]
MQPIGDDEREGAGLEECSPAGRYRPSLLIDQAASVRADTDPDPDEAMEDPEEADAEADTYAGMDTDMDRSLNPDDHELNVAHGEGAGDPQDPFVHSPAPVLSQPPQALFPIPPGPPGSSSLHRLETSDGFPPPDLTPFPSQDAPPPLPLPALGPPTASKSSMPPRPVVRPEAVTAPVYDIVPTIAAPHSTSINAIAATPDLRWVFTGGADGYIRRFNWADTANAKVMLTVAQRHPFVDSVTKAGVLLSYWENEEPQVKSPLLQPYDENLSLSPVYSLAVQSEGLWLLSGLDSGGINLQSVRHDEGKRITCLRKHASAVSVLTLPDDERSVLSGSWDKAVYDWDLNTGQVKRGFLGSGGQIASIEFRPSSHVPVPSTAERGVGEGESDTFSSSEGAKALRNGLHAGPDTNGAPRASPDPADVTGDGAPHTATQGSPAHSLFSGNDGDSLFGDYDDTTTTAATAAEKPSGDDEDDDLSRAIVHGLHEPEPTTAGMNDDAVALFGDAHRSSSLHGRLPAADDGRRLSSTDASDLPSSALPAHEKAGSLMTNGGLGHPDDDDDDVVSPLFAPRPPPPPPPPHSPPLPPPPPRAPTNGHHLPDTGRDAGLEAETAGFPPSASSAAAAAAAAADTTFLAASFDGTLRVWDRRQAGAIATILPRNGVPPWCMNACWSPDGNQIYAGRRNGTVEEYSLHAGLRAPVRTFKFPHGSGPVSAVKAMPNGRHLICASFDILRLHDLHQPPAHASKHSTVPFLIIPGHRGGVISSLFLDPTCRYLISTAGNRGWEGSTTEVLLGYEIGVPPGPGLA